MIFIDFRLFQRVRKKIEIEFAKKNRTTDVFETFLQNNVDLGTSIVLIVGYDTTCFPVFDICKKGKQWQWVWNSNDNAITHNILKEICENLRIMPGHNIFKQFRIILKFKIFFNKTKFYNFQRVIAYIGKINYGNILSSFYNNLIAYLYICHQNQNINRF